MNTKKSADLSSYYRSGGPEKSVYTQHNKKIRRQDVLIDEPTGIIKHQTDGLKIKVGSIPDKVAACQSGKQNLSDDFWCQIKIIPGPFVENTDGTADRTGDHIRYFLFCMPARSGTRGSSCDIMMKHSQHFFKEIIP